MTPIDKTIEWMGRLAIVDGLLSAEEEDVIRDYAKSIGYNCDDYLARLRKKSAEIETKVIPINANVIKGIEFENYIFNEILTHDDIKVLSRSADFKLGMGPALDERSLEPDFLLSHKYGRFALNYWIECKYRSSAETLRFQPSQIKRYIDVQASSSNPVFLIYGEGGTPSNPERLYLFHLDDILSSKVCDISCKGYYIARSAKLSQYEIKISDIFSTIPQY